MKNSIHLISHPLCPYVQRSVIVLTEKSIQFSRTDIDLGNKPDWFKKLSPLGRVPLLQIDNQHTLFESAVICEYLDETTPGSLHPANALEKAHHRSWIEFGSALLSNIAQLYNAQDSITLAKHRDLIPAKLMQLEPILTKNPFFAGQQFHLIDAVYGPIFRYFDVFEHVADLSVITDNMPNIQRWSEALSKRPSVKQAVADNYTELLTCFLVQRRSELSKHIDAAIDN